MWQLAIITLGPMAAIIGLMLFGWWWNKDKPAGKGM